MADVNYRQGVILAKTEVTYGVDPTPAVIDGILASVPQHDVSSEKKERDFMRSSLSPLGFVPGILKQTIKFRTELKGAGVAGTPETAGKLDRLFQACAMSSRAILRLPVSSIVSFVVGDTVTGGTSSATGIIVRTETGFLVLHTYSGTWQAAETVTGALGGTATVGTSPNTDERREYAPHSDTEDQSSVTLYYYMDRILHSLVGCRGTFAISCMVGEFPSVEFTFTGIYVAPADSTRPTGVSFELHDPAMCVSAGMQIGTYTPVGVASAVIDIGNTVADRKDMQSSTGLSGVDITARKPKLTVTINVDDLANYNPYTKFTAQTEEAVTWVVGSAAGNRVAFRIPAAQLEEPKLADQDGRAVYNLTFLPTGVDNEIIIQTY